MVNRRIFKHRCRTSRIKTVLQFIVCLGIGIAVFLWKYHVIVCGCINFGRSIVQGDAITLYGYPDRDLASIALDLAQTKGIFNHTCLALSKPDVDVIPFDEWRTTHRRDAHDIPYFICSRLFPDNETKLLKLKSNENYYQHVFQPCVTSRQRVPNIVHYPWFFGTTTQFRFHHYLSALSALKVLKPCHIIFWTDGYEPAGKWWDYFAANVSGSSSTLLVKTITPPACVTGKKLWFGEHKADWTKLIVMHEYGGIALDLDVIILKPFDPLMCYDFTAGREQPRGLNFGALIGVPRSAFNKLLLEAYKDYNPFEYGNHAVHRPHEIFCKNPDLVHVEHDTIHYPSWTPKGVQRIYEQPATFDWSKNYAMHLWYRKYDKDHNPDDIKTLISVFGSIARLTYYGSPDLIK